MAVEAGFPWQQAGGEGTGAGCPGSLEGGCYRPPEVELELVWVAWKAEGESGAGLQLAALWQSVWALEREREREEGLVCG